MVHKREAPEGEEDTFEWTEEEIEEGPEQLAALEGDEEVAGGAAWSPLFSSSNEHVKNQVCTAHHPVVFTGQVGDARPVALPMATAGQCTRRPVQQHALMDGIHCHELHTLLP